jgi:hypothetical protein
MKPSGLERFTSKRTGNGAARSEIPSVELSTPNVRSKSKRFEAEWFKMPRGWRIALRRAKTRKTYELALVILEEFSKRQRFGVTEVVLSTEATGMPRYAKIRAARDLAKLGLITLIAEGQQALRAIPHFITQKRYRKV